MAARVIEPVSKLDSLRVLVEAGVAPPSYATLKRRLRAYAKDGFRQEISAACAAHARLGRASLVLCDVSTLYFETGKGDGFRESGFSKERPLDLPGVTVVADAGMVSEANQKEIEAAGLSFILGMKIPDVPYVVKQWRREHPGEQVPDGHVFTQPWPAGSRQERRDQVTYYQYRADRTGNWRPAPTTSCSR